MDTNYATEYEDAYAYEQPNGGSWNNPAEVFTPRFVRLNLTVNL